MVICIPITPDGRVDPRWGRAARVAIADVQAGAVLGWQEFNVAWNLLHDETTEGGHHARVARFLEDHQVGTVVAGHMAVEMAHMLEQMGIVVRLGVGADARQAAVEASGPDQAPA